MLNGKKTILFLLTLCLAIFLGIFVVFLLGILLLKINNSFEYVRPCEPAQEKQEEAKPVDIKLINGRKMEASWYSIEHCLGCREDRLMANGEKLDDNKITCAYNYAPKNSKVRVRYGDKEIECLVTDRIGTDSRIDLTPAAFRQLADPDKGVLKNVLVYAL